MSGSSAAAGGAKKKEDLRKAESFTFHHHEAKNPFAAEVSEDDSDDEEVMPSLDSFGKKRKRGRPTATPVAKVARTNSVATPRATGNPGASEVIDISPPNSARRDGDGRARRQPQWLIDAERAEEAKLYEEPVPENPMVLQNRLMRAAIASEIQRGLSTQIEPAKVKTYTIEDIPDPTEDELPPILRRDEPPPLAPLDDEGDASGNTIVLTLKDADDNTKTFKLKMSDPLSKAAQRFAIAVGRDATLVKLLFDGRALDLNRPISNHDLEADDMLEVRYG